MQSKRYNIKPYNSKLNCALNQQEQITDCFNSVISRLFLSCLPDDVFKC
jgi:hypothetical protein